METAGRLRTSLEVTRALGISYRMLDYWCRTGLVEGHDVGSGLRRHFDDADFERLKFVVDLQRAGVAFDRIRLALDDRHALAALVSDLEKAAQKARDFREGPGRAPAARTRIPSAG